MTPRLALIAAFAATAAYAQPAPPPPPPKPACVDCGVVKSVNAYEQKGGSSGVGAVAGGVVGGVLGHQIGSGRGNTVATIAGAGAGALVGNEVERNHNTKTSWQVVIRMDAGNTRTFTYSSQPTVRSGDRVQLVDGGRRLALLAPH